MKILAIGDFHGKFPKKLKEEAKKVDVILVAGDFGGSDRLLKVVFKYLVKGKWWEVVGKKRARNYVLEDYNSGKKILNDLHKLEKPVYAIMGNWDFDSKAQLETTAGLKLKTYPNLMKNLKITYWKRGIKRMKGLKILAFGGMVTAGAYLEKGVFSDKKWRKNKKKNKRETEQIMKHGAKDVDILFSHYPPHGVFDKVDYPGENPMNGKHVGFKGYTEYIKKYKPKVFICGHMHEYQGKKKFENTLVIATGAAKDGKAVVLDIEKGKINSVRFIK
jgi:Icc-related predicted phosphoesterase